MIDDRLPLAEPLADAGGGDFPRTEAVAQSLTEAKVGSLLGAGRHGRSGGCATHRNGGRGRVLDTRLGSLQLRIPEAAAGRLAPTSP